MSKQFYLDNGIDYDGNPLDIDFCNDVKCQYYYCCEYQCHEQDTDTGADAETGLIDTSPLGAFRRHIDAMFPY